MGVASAIYKGSASYGRFIAIVTAIIATLIGIALVVMGIAYNVAVSKRTLVATGTVISKNCSNGSSNNKSNVCDYTVEYKDENGNVNNATLSTTGEYILNSTMSISYGKEDKKDIVLTSDNNKSIGYGMIVFGIIITLLAWGWVWVTRTYEFAASTSGISSAYNFFRR